MGSEAPSISRIASATARAARSWPAPARTWRIRTRRLVEMPASAREGVGDVLDPEPRPVGLPGDPNDVEPDRQARQPAARQVPGGRARHVLALLPPDRRERRRRVGAGSEFYLHEDHGLAVPRDQVDLAASLADVSPDHRVPAKVAHRLSDPLPRSRGPLPPGHPRPPRSPRTPPARRGVPG